MNKLSELKSALGAGARANKYRVNFSIPSVVPVSSNLQNADALCKASSFPGVSVGQIEVFNQGRKLILPGDTVYTNDWALTFYTTEDHALRKDLISWMVSADNFQNNQHSGNPAAIMGELSVEQLDSAGKSTVKYTFHNVFVKDIGELTVGDDTADTIHEFEATFSFTDWVVGDGSLNAPLSGNAPSLNDVAK